MKKTLLAVLFWSVMAGAQAPANQSAPPSLGLRETVCVVRLLSPLSTRTAREGDMFTASVEQPNLLTGAVVEGRITKLKRPGRGTGKAELQFQFETITWRNQTEKIKAELTDVKNSQGKSKVDEEGHVIGVTSKKKRILGTVFGAAAGAAMGAAAGGSKGAVIGAVAGGAAGFFVSLKMTTAGSEIEFKPGAFFTLTISDAGR